MSTSPRNVCFEAGWVPNEMHPPHSLLFSFSFPPTGLAHNSARRLPALLEGHPCHLRLLCWPAAGKCLHRSGPRTTLHLLVDRSNQGVKSLGKPLVVQQVVVASVGNITSQFSGSHPGMKMWAPPSLTFSLHSHSISISI